MRFALTLLALLSMSAVASSKCALKNYAVRGVVVRGDGVPVADAKITASWATKQKQQVTTAETDAAGRFMIEVAFDSYSGSSIFGDRCEMKLGSIVVVAKGNGDAKSEREVSASEFDVELKLILR